MISQPRKVTYNMPREKERKQKEKAQREIVSMEV